MNQATPLMALTYIHRGSHTTIPATASSGLIFLREYMSAIDSLEPNPGALLGKFLTQDAEFVFNGSQPISAGCLLVILGIRNSKLSKYVHEGDIAWEIQHELGQNPFATTVIYESTNVVSFKDGERGLDIKKRQLSILELVKDDAEWKLAQSRVFVNPIL